MSHSHRPHRDLCVSVNWINIWGILWYKRLGERLSPSKSADQICSLLLHFSLIHARVKIPERELTDYVDGKIPVLCHLGLFQFTFQFGLKTRGCGSRMGCGLGQVFTRRASIFYSNRDRFIWATMEWHKAQYSCWSSISYTNLTSCQHIDPNLYLQRFALATLAAIYRDLLWKKAQVTQICISKGLPQQPWQLCARDLLWKEARWWGREVLPQNPHIINFLPQRDIRCIASRGKHGNTLQPVNCHEFYYRVFTATFAGCKEN